MPLHFAVAGSPRTTPSPGGTLAGLQRTQELGITAMELEWVQRVPGNVEHVEAIGSLAREFGILLTVHAPYYVNLNALESATLHASKKRIIQALTMAQICGARSVCVHAAFNLGMESEAVYENVRKAVDDIMSRKSTYFPDVNLALETMGKPTQFGTLEDVLRISKEFDLYPCLDPAHLHARSNGKVNSVGEWNEMFDLYEATLGKESLKNVHMHYSGISYGPKGEKKHLPLMESDARWKEFLKVLQERKIEGVLVCESPVQEEDTQLMKRTFDHL